jgi:hypothetical protein
MGGKAICIGYYCICGDRVQVARFLPGIDQVNEFPAVITVTCRKGHAATVTADQFAILEHWESEE